jgi:type III restriction enzyme
MARSRGTPQTEAPPPDWAPTQAVPDPILNTPYDEPTRHWLYGKDGRPSENPGRRRASYFYKTKKTGSAQQSLLAEEESDDLPLVNRLRADVKRWRESGYRGASAVTKDLLTHWMRRDSVRPLFFCQREAVETAIYLLELVIPGRLGSTGFKNFEVGAEDLGRLLAGARPSFHDTDDENWPRLVDIPGGDGWLPLRRLGCKMATGSGKTVVMAMLVSWAFCNRGRNPASKHFPNAVLICAPNLTIRKRLQVLKPEQPQSYYDQFDLVPAKYRELLNSGKVHVTNWHGFAPKSPNREGDTSYKVVDKGEETPEAFTRDRLQELASRLPILVLNDEGHHCWRPKPDAKLAAKDKDLTKEERAALEEDAEEARVWLAGLDRINASGLAGAGQPGILACVDLSATPFYLGNSGYPEGSPFPWLVSDFGLIDAIECGIVKVPRLPVLDAKSGADVAGRPDPKYFRLWAHIGDKLKANDRLPNKRPKPEAVFREAQGALVTLAGQWKERFDEIVKASPDETIVPPVMIVVCDNTEVSQIFYERISGERQEEVEREGGKTETVTVYEPSRALLPELANTEGVRRTVRIDTRLLAKVETEEGETKDQAAAALREIIDTVGKRGGVGEQVRCVVSVSMLTEGWDATNVTHILGVRAFDSQLLCEQVVGRGLRRMNYRPGADGKLDAEYVDVYGIPFSIIPFKGKPKDAPDKQPVYHHVYALPERSSYEIRMPLVESYTYELRESGITCQVDSLEEVIVNEEPIEVLVTAIRGIQDEAAPVLAVGLVKHDRSVYYESIRMQRVVFEIARAVTDDLVQGAAKQADSGGRGTLHARHQVFPDVLRIVQEYVGTKVKPAPGVDLRELALDKYRNLVRERVRAGILPAAARAEHPLYPIVNSFKPMLTTAEVNYRTTRPVVPLTRSHLNLAPLDSSWEQDAIDVLEELPIVACYAPNDRNVGLAIPYDYQENILRYEPDYIVRLVNGVTVLVEIKGKGGEIHGEDAVLAKNAGASKWVAAVNNAGRYGRWAFEICREVEKLGEILKPHAGGAVFPFTFVTPAEGDKYRTCVPLASVRGIARRTKEKRGSLDAKGTWFSSWVAPKAKMTLEEGMFVAWIQAGGLGGDNPKGAWCLFRDKVAGGREGKTLFVRHGSLRDLTLGPHVTLGAWSSEDVVGDDKATHRRVRLASLNPEGSGADLVVDKDEEVEALAEFVAVLPESAL